MGNPKSPGGIGGETPATVSELLGVEPAGILSFFPDPTLIIDRAGRVVAWNRAIEELTGVAAADMLGKGDYEYALPFYGERRPMLIDLVGAPRAEEEKKYSSLQRRGDTLSGESPTPFLPRGGAYLFAKAALLRNAAGEVIGAIECFHDISDRKAMEAALEKAKDAAESANRTKSAFLANMSHELRTPMNAVIGYSEMLIEDCEEKGLESYVADLKIIRAAGRHLLSLINDVLDISKIEAGKMYLFLEDFEAKQLVEDVVSTVQPLVEKNANTLHVELSGELGKVHADLTQTRQVLFNLISNACKFTQKGTVTLTARRFPSEGRDWLELRVRDTGIGMTPTQVGRLFQVFSQADSSTTRKYGGSGLGLAISQKFCQMMGGEITVESELGKGSTFTARIPALVVPPEQAQVVVASPAPAPPAREAPADKPPVLVIDDDSVALDLMSRMLAKEDFRVVIARSGAEGLRLAREAKPCLITLDVLMPGMDGWAVLRELKADPGLADIPVIIVSMVENREMGYALGIADYYLKPFGRDAIVKLLRRHAQPDLPVLVVEDEPSTRRMLVAMLKKEGWQVLEAGNGREALQRTAESRPGLILLDLNMPEMDGFEFLEELRKGPLGHTVPVVVVTAKDLTAEDRRRLDGLIERVIQKGSFGASELMGEVRRLVLRHAGRGEEAQAP